jgi:hypothetical protein
MRTALAASIALVLALACDSGPAQDAAKSSAGPQDGAAKTSAPAGEVDAKTGEVDTKTGDTAGKGAGGDAPTPRFASLSECIDSCDHAGKIPSNRETCRLNCDAVYGASAGGAPADTIGAAVSCLGRCYAGEAQPADCALGCKRTAASAAPAPAPEVIDRLSTCVQTCHADRSVSATNRSTCELNCGQAARVGNTPPPSATPTETKR